MGGISDPAAWPSEAILVARLRARALDQGFSAFGVSDARAAWEAGARLEEFLALGRHGEMGWMAETAARRAHPTALWPEAKSAIVLGLNYTPPYDPMQRLLNTDHGVVSVYAARRDYHDLIKGKLKTLAQWIAAQTQADVKVFVDTAPLMEKPLAQRAGLGWQGKHTNLVSRESGSWLLLGVILTSAELPPDAPEADHCGSCRACLDICPTAAFPAPYQLDARRCLAYLTIEHAGSIPQEFRKPMGNRVFGCDDCLAVCPWNKFAASAHDARHALKEDLALMPLGELLGLDDAAFRVRFAGTPVKRTGRDRVVRNALIAAGNSGDEKLVSAVQALLGDGSALVRGAAVWALRQLCDQPTIAALRARHAPGEADETVQAEWNP
jgi:epoxyqueuosine reductase